MRGLPIACLAVLGALVSAPAGAEPLAVALTADTEGYLVASAGPTPRTRLGGLARRASIVRDLRKADPSLLVLDAGNFLHGPASVASGGRVVVAAYDAIGYDAVNLSWRDLRGGKGRAFAVLGGADFDVISANLIDEATGRLLARPYVVRPPGGRKVAVIGLTEAPPGLERLPHLRRSLTGVRIQPPVEALATFMPRLKEDADRIVLLYHGSLPGLRPLLDRFGGDLAAVLVGGIRPEHLPRGTRPPLIGTSPYGAHVAHARLGAGAPSVSQIALDETIASDPALEKVLEAHARPEPWKKAPARAEETAAPPAGLSGPPETGQAYPLALTGRNRAARLTVDRLALVTRHGGREAREGHRLLVLRTEWENVIPLTIVEERALATTYRITDLRNHLYLVVDGRRVARVDPRADGIPGHVSSRPLSLEKIGSRERGDLVFEVPDAPPRRLELRLYDYAHGHVVLPILDGEVDEEAPRGGLRRNRVLEAGVFGLRRTRTLGARTAPEGMVFVVVDLRARSCFTEEADASGFDPAAPAGRTIRMGTVADWKETRRYLQAVVDGEYAHVLEPETALADPPRFLPDVLAGEEAVFLVPETLTSLELRCDFPNAQPPGGEVFHPEPLVFPLEGTRPELPARPALLAIDDEVFDVRVTGQETTDRFAGEAAGAGKRFLVWDVTVSGTSGKGEIFQTSRQLRYAAEDGSRLSLDAASGRGPRRSVETLWIPAGERRSFQAVFRVPDGERKPRLAYQGVSMAKVFDLPALEGGEAGERPSPAEPPVEPPTERPEVPPDRPREEPAPTRPAELPEGVKPLTGAPFPGFRPAAATAGGVELSVVDARLVPECRGEKAGDGKILVVVQTIWRRAEGTKDWDSYSLGFGLFLHRGGRFLEPIWSHGWGAEEGYLPGRIVLDDETPTCVAKAVFAVPEESLAGSTLIFADQAGKVLRVPLAPASVDRAPLPVLGRAGNEAFDIIVHDIVDPGPDARKRLEGYLAAEKTFIGLRVSVASRGAPLQLKRLHYAWQLIAGDDFPCPSYSWLSGSREGEWPIWGRELRLLPGVWQHGVLLHAVPSRDVALRFELHHPGLKGPDKRAVSRPRLILPLTEGGTRSQPSSLATIRENGWEVRLLGVRPADRGNYRLVVLDLWVRAPEEKEKATIAREDFLLLDQAGKKASTGGRELGSSYGLASRVHVPPGASRRFDSWYTLKDGGERLWVRIPGRCPTALVHVPNPRVSEERALLDARKLLPVMTGETAPYDPPALLPEPQPRGIDGVGLTGAQVNEAIRKGARYLLHVHRDGFDPRQKDTALVILALLHSGELGNHPALRAKAVECLERRKFESTYDAALTIMALARVDPERYRARIERIAQVLVDGQSEDGRWSYLYKQVAAVEPLAPAGAPPETERPAASGRILVEGGEPIPGWDAKDASKSVTLKRTTPWGKGGDNSCSQYAILGLRAAAAAGVRAPRETWVRTVSWFLEAQDRERGWGYGKGGAYGSMTTAGLAGLSVACFQLGETSAEADRALCVGVDWLARNFCLDSNPAHGLSWHYYYLYGLERAGRLLAKEFLGSHEWYPEGARYLVDQQAEDGSWTGLGSYKNVIHDTCYALLFLTRATEALGERKKVPTGPGRLEVVAEAREGSVLFILDASGSMGARLGEETRFDAARRVVLETLRGGGAGLDVALRVYGHRYAAIHRQANEDSELVVGFGPSDRPELAAALSGLRFRGKTPLTFSLKAALGDLRGARSARKRVILLTDGLESDRRARPVDAAEALAAAGVRLDVVGLCVENVQMLERMAKAGGGACYAASDAAQLLEAFRTVLTGKASFRVLDGKGARVAQGKAGTAVELPAGPYDVEVDLPGGVVRVRAWVHQDRTTVIRAR